MTILNIRNSLKIIFPLSLLLITACTPLMHSTRSGDRVKVVSNDGAHSCTPIIFFWGRAQEECEKIGKNSSLDPSSVITTKNRFCQSDGVYEATYTCQGAGTKNQKPALSRLELRAMQSRKFDKPPQDVAKSINELYKDKSQQCVGVAAPVMTCSSGIMMRRFLNGKQSNFCANPNGSPAADQQMIKHPSQTDGFCFGQGFKATFSIDPGNPSQTSTILRIRIADLKNSTSAESQITDPQAYSLLFKEIADGLFIDAIVLTPAEMQ